MRDKVKDVEGEESETWNDYMWNETNKFSEVCGF